MKAKGRRQKEKAGETFLPSAFCLRPSAFPWHWFVLSAAVPLVHCASRLDLDLWHDEIYTVDHFVARGPWFIVTDYSLPNNHVLYSLVLWPFYLLSDVNFVLRLPSFLFTAGTLAIVFSLALRHSGLVGAVLSTSLLGLNQMFLIHTMQVRGYGLSMFLTAWLSSLALADEVISWRRRCAIVVAGAALLYVMPTNVLFFMPLAVLSIVRTAARRISLRHVLWETAGWSTAALLALACYLPIAAQVQAAAKSSSPGSWTALPWLAIGFFRPATYDNVWFAPLMIASLIALVWPRGDGSLRRWTLPVVCVGVVAGAFLLTGLRHLSPFARNYCPLLVLLALAAGWLLAELAATIGRLWQKAPAAETTAVVALAVVSLVLWPRLWTYPERLQARREQANPADPWIADGYFCYYAANYRPSAVVRHLLDQHIERIPYRICYSDADFLNLWWYFAHTDLYLFRGPPESERVLFVVVPVPEPWNTIEHDCRLSADHIQALSKVDSFGYYSLYQSDTPLDVGWPPDAETASQHSAAAAQ